MSRDPSAGRLPFEPIAIVGQGCILPGCTSPAELWATAEAGRSQIGDPPPGDWQVDLESVLSPEPGRYEADRTWSVRGGYVRGFDGASDGAFEPADPMLDPELLAALDPVFRWSLHAARDAMRGMEARAGARAGVVLGNLSYPTRAFTRLAEQEWVRRLAGRDPAAGEDVHPWNRFMSGLPAMLVARALGLGGGAMALDAACASGVYAIKIACDRLHDRRADLMLAGGVNAADQLFLHVGFSALNALSRSGRSRPFSSAADGLVPAEGAAFVALKRLDDALAHGDRILGVIRSVGLSNDGRGGGFLSPSREGQEACMREALALAGLAADAVQYVECHATGTTVGDATEIRSLREVYGDHPLALGSLKANLGHSLTASGLAGLLKVIGAMEAGRIPPVPDSRPLSDALSSTAFRVPESSEAWAEVEGQRTAAVSGFGFGGNNAHLILQQHPVARSVAVPGADLPPAEVAIVAVAARTHLDPTFEAFARRVLTGEAPDPAYDPDRLELPARGLAFPPNELREALGQQLVLLELVRTAARGLAPLEPTRTGVFVGMQTDAIACRYGLRKRQPALAGAGEGEGGSAGGAPALIGSLSSAGVIGKMPNVCANRLSNQLDVRGPGFAVSREELSGDAALDLACTAIRRGEIDTALVAAVDFCREEVHAAAAARVLGPAGDRPADAAVLLVAKSRARAEADGDRVLALVRAGDAAAEPDLSNDPESSPIHRALGHAHAASGLLHVALGAAMVQSRCRPGDDAAPRPWLPGEGPMTLDVLNRSFGGDAAAWRITAVPATSRPLLRTAEAPTIRRFAAPDLPGLLERLRADDAGDGEGGHRLALVGAPGDLDRLRRRAIERLEARGDLRGPPLEGVYHRARPLGGELGFAFTGAASAYPGMARELLLALPRLVDGLRPRLADPAAAGDWIYRPGDPRAALSFHQLAGSSLVCQLHAELSRSVLGLRPDAVLGLSSGETNAMFALGAWERMDDLFREIDASELYRSALAGRFEAVREHWGLEPGAPVDWHSFRVRAPVERVRAAIGESDRVYLCIVNTPADCVIGGDATACAELLSALGDPPAVPLGHDLAIHCPAVQPFEAEWRRLHTRPTRAVPGVRFYSNFLGGAYEPTRESVADALTGQAIRSLDLPRIVEKAWDDGVRVFVEHGPRNSLSVAIGEILGDREHLAVSLDRAGVSAIAQACSAAAALWCAGVPVELESLAETAAGSPAEADAREAGPVVVFRLRPEPVGARPSARVSAAEAHPAGAPEGALVYRVPSLRAGPAGGRPVPPPPPLARLTRAPRESEGVSAPAPAPAAAAVSPTAYAPAAVAPLPSHPVPAPALAAGAGPGAPPAGSPGALLVAAHHDVVVAHSRYLEAQRGAMAAYLETMERVRARAFGTGSAQAPPAMVPAAAPGIPQPVPAPPPAQAPALAAGRPRYPGPSFDRAQLEVLAAGRISSVFGEAFADQDAYPVQVRMPEPPLLLCDRVLGIEGEPHGMGQGTIWTETDVRPDSWYLHHGRMPAGLFIEAGQADLLLISWLGIDRFNRGERAYRLLGCDLTFHGELPKPGDTLRFEIHVEGHARHGDVRLFFFRYDCRVDGELRLSVRNGQAGFFSLRELNESAGVIWTPEGAEYTPGAPVEAGPRPTARRSFGAAEVEAFLAGDLAACFGEEFLLADTHTRTPRPAAGEHSFLGPVADYDPTGGPAGRGYLRVERPVSPDDWFFEGHFKNDPCMPGTLMAEGCLQAMAFYMAGMGWTLRRDGWRFEPVADQGYRFRCRGQVTPESKEIVYELFVDEVTGGDTPTLFAHVLCTVDGRKAFLCERLGLRLVPDWPLSSMEVAVPGGEDARPLARLGDFPLDHASLIHCAWGRPTLAFGPGFAHYDGPRRSPRLPGPPYHFMTRILRLDAEMGRMQPGARVRAVYDFRPDEWYFRDNPSGTMPNCVLMEIGLQPCGWLASLTLDPEAARRELLFRNLDGESVQHREIDPRDGSIETEVELLSVSRMGDFVIEKFSVVCSVAGEVVLEMETAFGFFPPAAMENQKGFGTEPSPHLPADGNLELDLAGRPERLFGAGGAARLPGGRLGMLHRITGHWPAGGGEAGLGALRAEMDVEPGAWFFRSHFFQDPVQPGSLGVEAILQAIQAFMLLEGMDDGIPGARFQPIDIGGRAVWHYRGQVTPERERVVVEFEAAERGVDESGPFVLGSALLRVDGLQIYRVPRIGMRIVGEAPREVEWSVDLARADDRWLADHRPTHTLPALPLAYELELMARAAAEASPGTRILGVERAEASRWITLPDGRASGRMRVTREGNAAEVLLEERDAVGRLAPKASARIRFADGAPARALEPLEPLEGAVEVADPYAEGSLFHGPAFRLMRELRRGGNGARATLDPASPDVPRGLLHPVLLDAALHCVPHDAFHLWCGEPGRGMAAYPMRIESLHLFGALDGDEPFEVEARFRGLEAGRSPRTHLRISRRGEVLVAFDLVEVMLPKGRLGELPAGPRTEFLKARRYVPGATLATVGERESRVLRQDVLRSDWLPGTLAALYGIPEGVADLAREIAIRDHVGFNLRIHPAEVRMAEGLGACRNLPLNGYGLRVEAENGSVRVLSEPPAPLRWEAIRDAWIERAGGDHRFVHDLGAALIRRCARRVVLSDPEGFRALEGRPVLYLANHQTAVESFLFLAILAPLAGTAAGAIAKREHRDSWIGGVHRLADLAMGAANPLRMLFFERDRQSHMLELLGGYGAALADDPYSLLVHVDGTRATQGGVPVRSVSSVLLDLALERALPIVPVRFAGGLPADPVEQRLELPYGLGRQDYHLGAAIHPDELRAMPYAERARRVRDAINGLGPAGADDRPLAGATPPESAAVPDLRGVLREMLAEQPGLGAESRALLRGRAGGRGEADRIAAALIGDSARTAAG